MENIAKSTHPLILIAAASVTIASLAAAAHFTGLLPGKSSEAPPAAVASALVPPPVSAPVAAEPEAAAPVAAPPVAAPPARPAGKAHRQQHNPGVADRNYDERGAATRRVAVNDAGIDVIPARPPQVTNPAPPTVAPAPPVCHECGTVESINEVKVQGEGTGLGAVAGGVLGGVLGHQVGGGKGRDLATIAGAVGGAFAGHQVEKSVRSEKQYEVTVHFDDGNVRTFTQKSATGWHNGERVRLDNGAIRSL